MAALCAVPVAVVTQLKAGNPHWKIDPYLRQLVTALGPHGQQLRANIAQARARIWASQRFGNQSLQSFNGVRGGVP